MKKALCFAVVALVSSTAFGDLICTINRLEKRGNSGSYVGRIVGIPMVDLSKSSEFNNFIIKKDGTLLSNVRYADMVYKPTAKLGDVDGAVFIALSRDQGAKEGINVNMGTLSNNQEFASFEVAAESQFDNVTLNYSAKAAYIHCQVPTK